MNTAHTNGTLTLNDAGYYAGVALLGVGLAFATSWPIALAVVGGVLIVTNTATAFAVTLLEAWLRVKRGT